MKSACYKLVLATAVWGGCTSPDAHSVSPPSLPKDVIVAPYRLESPDLSYVFTESQRAAISSDFDVDAVQSLLQYLPAEDRSRALRAFVVQGPMESTQIIHFGEPVLDALLERAWAPAWSTIPDQFLDDPELQNHPGVATEKRLRDSRKRRDGND